MASGNFGHLREALDGEIVVDGGSSLVLTASALALRRWRQDRAGAEQEGAVDRA